MTSDDEPTPVKPPADLPPLDVADLKPADPKAGSASPWAVFDAWGAGTETIHDGPSAAELAFLDEGMVRIPRSEEDDGEGFPSETEILESYDKLLKSRSSRHFGYPYNLSYNHEELAPFMRYSINNLGDPFIPSNYGVHSRQFETAVVDFFAQLWGIQKPDYWGYVTTCGTEGNLHGILLAREILPDGVLYTSRESHYSLFKAAHMYRMESCAIPTLPTGEMNYDELERAIQSNKDKPVIINCNIGTTVKGAVDNLDRILRILTNLNIPRERFYIHCDGALFALLMPFLQWAPDISFRKPIDSVAVSGHKMLGCPMPCGVVVTRKAHIKKVEKHIDYLNSVDTTIMGSRNGQAALYMWYSLRKKGMKGIKADVEHCIETAAYLRDTLRKEGIACRLNDLSCTVVMERPTCENFVQRWQLACEDDIAHVVVMPNILKEKIDVFVTEFVASRKEVGITQPSSKDSPLSGLKLTSW